MWIYLFTLVYSILRKYLWPFIVSFIIMTAIGLQSNLSIKLYWYWYLLSKSKASFVMQVFLMSAPLMGLKLWQIALARDCFLFNLDYMNIFTWQTKYLTLKYECIQVLLSKFITKIIHILIHFACLIYSWYMYYLPDCWRFLQNWPK